MIRMAQLLVGLNSPFARDREEWTRSARRSVRSCREASSISPLPIQIEFFHSTLVHVGRGAEKGTEARGAAFEEPIGKETGTRCRLYRC